MAEVRHRIGLGRSVTGKDGNDVTGKTPISKNPLWTFDSDVFTFDTRNRTWDESVGFTFDRTNIDFSGTGRNFDEKL